MQKLKMSEGLQEAYRKAGGFGKLYEAIIERDPDLGATMFNRMCEQASRNPLFLKIKDMGIEEGLFSSDASALGYVYGKVSDIAQPNTLGRDLLTVIPTTKPTLRYPKALTKAKAQKISEKSPLLLGEKYTYVDIDCDIEIATGEKWTESFIEDAEWDVLNRQVEAIGRGLAYTETEDIIAMYNTIAAANLAGAAEITP